MASFPELLDVGIMGHCVHGKSGLCVKAGVECYQDGLHAAAPNMTLEDFREIVRQCRGKTYQIALGGCGDPDQHEHFAKILDACRSAGIVPNFTTSGLGLNSELAQLCKKHCGAVAVSWYRSTYTLRAIDLLFQADVITNIHYVVSNSTIEEAVTRLKERSFPVGVNAIVFFACCGNHTLFSPCCQRKNSQSHGSIRQKFMVQYPKRGQTGGMSP